MAEENAMSCRILQTLENILKSDPELQEFGIIPTEDNTRNKSPVVYEEHNLGLESWCIKHVYQYACSTLFQNRELLLRNKLGYNKMENMNHILIGAILINPECTTFWNMKRNLVENDILKIEDELHFSKIVLTFKSKSFESFSYRRWLLKRQLEKFSANNLEIPMSLLQNEFAVTNMASEKIACNYHSWNHRLWCMEHIASNCQTISNIIYSELSYSQEWINNHISEHTGYHYRQYLIKLVRGHKKVVAVYDSYYNFVVKSLLKMMNDGDYSNLLTYLMGKPSRTRILEEKCSYVNYISILLYDLCVLVDKLNNLYPEHEALFYHRRFLVYHLLKVPYEYHGLELEAKSKNQFNILMVENKNITDSSTVVNVSENVDNRWPKLFKMSPKSELYNLYGIVSNCEKSFASKNCSVLQIAKYRKWLKHVVGFD
ncbi:unnamed protein product [Phaedon cochleariae]|uniref:Protein prenyltransferase alpha subunit repeat-containing protein 1 n=1 Tax=Phaedon cochleariae TaxID=80249 RepID=A0A9N9SB62_PHACE|nr:unnamed protein product [Phaedon cochleariae]